MSAVFTGRQGRGTATLCLMLGIAGCGGGGGGASLGPSDPTAPITLNQTNALAVAQELEYAWVASILLANTFELDLTAFLLRDLVDSGASGTIPEFTVNCGFAGTATISADIGGGNTYHAGDTFTMTYDDCQPASDEFPIANGTATVVIDDFTGALGGADQSVTFTVDTDDLAITRQAPSVLTARGIGTYQVTFTADYEMGFPVSQTRTTISESLAMELNGHGFVRENMLDFALLAWSGIGGPPSDQAYEFAGNVVSEELEGSVEVSTPVPLAGPFNTTPGSGASEGRLVIAGNGGTEVWLLPEDAFDVRLDVDSNGDGFADGQVDTTWDELRTY